MKNWLASVTLCLVFELRMFENSIWYKESRNVKIRMAAPAFVNNKLFDFINSKIFTV